MSPRTRVALMLVILLLAMAGGAYFWFSYQRASGVDELLARLPTQDATVGHLDAAALRRAGLIGSAAGSVVREPEYEAFIRKSGFNWEQDLDQLTFSFTPDATYFFVSGRFDWPRLQSFVRAEGGECQNEFCTISGSTPERQISFFPYRKSIMALAVSPDRYAADQLRVRRASTISHPSSPFWIHFSSYSLRAGSVESPGLKGFQRILQRTEQVTLSLAQNENTFSLLLTAQCPSAEQASALAADLTKLTEWLNTLLKIESTDPGETELAGVLAGGKFSASGTHLRGEWPLPRAFLGNLFAEQ